MSQTLCVKEGKLGEVRPCEREDLPAVADLFQRVFRRTGTSAPESLRHYLQELYFEHPWQDPRCTSFVHVSGGGQLGGFIGAFPLRLCLGDRPLLAAVAGSFMVDHEVAGPLVGAKLLRTLLHGGQDLTLSDSANEVSRKMWEAAGGATCFAQSLSWIRPLRPGQLALGALVRRKIVPRLVGSTLMYPTRACDWMAARIVKPLMPKSPEGFTDTDLALGELLQSLQGLERQYALRPYYDGASLAWVLDQAHRKNQYGPLHMRAVRDASGRVVGWFMYYVQPGKMARVLQLGALPHAMRATADRLTLHAWEQGAAAVEARISPRWIAPLYRRDGVFLQRRPYVVMHAQRPELTEALDHGDAFFSRLEGEWWTKLTSDRFV